MKYTELVSKPKPHVRTKKCEHCGREFTPVDVKGVGSCRRYCLRLDCEREREQIRIHKAKVRRNRKKKKTVVKDSGT